MFIGISIPKLCAFQDNLMRNFFLQIGCLDHYFIFCIGVQCYCLALRIFKAVWTVKRVFLHCKWNAIIILVDNSYYSARSY